MEICCNTCNIKRKYGVCGTDKMTECTFNNYCMYEPISNNSNLSLSELDRIRMNLYKDSYLNAISKTGRFTDAKNSAERLVEDFDNFFNIVDGEIK